MLDCISGLQSVPIRIDKAYLDVWILYLWYFFNNLELSKSNEEVGGIGGSLSVLHSQDFKILESVKVIFSEILRLKDQRLDLISLLH